MAPNIATTVTAPLPGDEQCDERPDASASTSTLPSNSGQARGVTDHVAVLTDGGQDAGLATLINSLVRNRFDGTLWVGWRGHGADLFDALPRQVTDQITVRLIELQTTRPLAFYKPDFLETIWQLAGPAAASVMYMDCDIVLGCDWAFVSAWVEGGLAVVEDLPHRSVGADHPLRRAWKSVMSAAGVPPVREVAEYFNSGFVGVPAACRAILPVWSAMVLEIEGMTGVRGSGPEPHYARGVRAARQQLQIPDSVRVVMRQYLLEDQDALNMALMASNVPLCPMGPDAMGFTSARTPIVVHALGPDKPWSAQYLRRLVRHGAAPSFADDMWWRYSDSPIAVPAARRRTRRWSWRVAKALGRYM